MSKEESRGLTRREFDAVIRRATELASSDSDGGEGALTEAELYRIASEVGLTQQHVRQALAEVRSWSDQKYFLDRIFGPPSIQASCIVPGTPGELAVSIDDFLVASQLLQPVQRSTTILHYRPAVDWASKLARAASFSFRKYYIASARSIEVYLEPVESERTLVKLVIDPGTRGDDLARAVLGGLVGGGALGVLVVWVLTMMIPAGLAVLVGLIVGAGMWSGIAYAFGYAHKRKLTEVRSEVDDLLYALEAGLSLEPPPPSWRRWVKRHFHGVARDFMGNDSGVGS